jgi:hypothetical protein
MAHSLGITLFLGEYELAESLEQAIKPVKRSWRYLSPA